MTTLPSPDWSAAANEACSQPGQPTGCPACGAAVKLSFRVRLTILLMVLLSLICYGLEPDVISRYHAMRLRFLGAKVTYGFKPGWLVSISPAISTSDFLMKGRRHLDCLSKDIHLNLYLNRTNVTDSDLSLLKDISGHVYLEVSETSVSDAGLNHLLDIKHLGGVRVLDSNVTERGYREFSTKRGWKTPEDISDWISSKPQAAPPSSTQ